VTDLQFAAALVNSLAWPTAVVVAAVLLRKELRDAFRRMQHLKFPGGEATFATLAPYEKVIAAVAKDAGSPEDAAVARREESAFGVLEELAATESRQAIIDAWSLLEYQLNTASDRVAPNQPHGWPQVALNLEGLDKWPLLLPAIQELRRLRDYTVESRWPPSSAAAFRYVSLAQDLATTLRASVQSQYGDRVDTGGGR
jgi:hypothetical protein